VASLLKEIRSAANAVRDAAGEERRLLADRRSVPAQPSFEDLGAIAVELAFDWCSWIDRRERFIEFVEDTTLRRTTRVHFTFPQTLARHATRGSLIFVPLDILPKGHILLHSEVRDEDDRLLSPLNKERNGLLSGHGLVGFFSRRMGTSFPAGAAELMMQVARQEDVSEAEKAVQGLSGLPNMALYLASTDPWRAVEARLLTDDLKAGFLLAVMVEYQPGKMRVLEYAYDVRQPWHDPNARRRDKARLAVGALPRRITLRKIEIGRAVSNRIEVIAPGETDIAAGHIEREHFVPKKAPVEISKPADGQSRSRAQFYVPLFAGATRSKAERVFGRGDTATVTVSVMPRAGGVLAAVLLSSAATTVALIVFALSLTHLDGQTSGAILLLVPAVVAAYIVREREHPYTTRSLLGIRGLAAISAACGFLVALMIASEAFTGSSAATRSTATTTTTHVTPSSTVQRATIEGSATIRPSKITSTSRTFRIQLTATQRATTSAQSSTTPRPSTAKGSSCKSSAQSGPGKPCPINETHQTSPRLSIWKIAEWMLAVISTLATIVLGVAMLYVIVGSRSLEEKLSGDVGV
jgi:hypothetical protein